MNAIDLLKTDHVKVQALFRQYDRAEAQLSQRRELVEQIFTELEVHATIEEELFYPAVQAQMRGQITGTSIEGDETEYEPEDLVTEAQEDHQEVKSCVAALRAMHPDDAQFEAKFAELRESVEEHIGMEEDELMPDAVGTLGGELEQLGRRLEERKEQLMAGKS
jgi:hypothetical protein